ncbi:MAG: nucleotide exchange factor GrpE [Spirochaetaceae bacterium]|jgi:molecular chaperone GrpE|nr:nucleotide exchange factor GrpE [Spirochaetaceae bacterium]
MGENTGDKKVNSAEERESGIDQDREDGLREPEAGDSGGQAGGRDAEVPAEARTEDDAAEEAAGEPSPEQIIADLEGKNAELNDRYLRKAADFDNFRKRMTREKQDAIDFANQSLILDLIPIIDDFERAIKAAETAIAGAGGVSGGDISKDFTALYEGISMTEKRLLTQLENRWGLKRYDSAGEPFDPNFHEALMMEKSADITEAIVQEEWTKGYTLKDRVIRTAQVKVLMPEDPGRDAAGNGGSPS